MKTQTLSHIGLNLKHRPVDAVNAIATEIKDRALKDLESTKDPEELLRQRKALREKKEALQDKLKQKKASIAKSNKQRKQMIAQWEMFKEGVVALSRKHGVDFAQFPAHLATGRTFIQKLESIDPTHFVEVEGLRIPSPQDESRLEEVITDIYDVEVREKMLEEIIARKAEAMKELFSSDPE